MPGYELALVFRTLERSKLAEAIKRISLSIASKGVVLRTYENHGEKKLPYAMRDIDSNKHYQGHYFNISFDASPNSLTNLQDELERDVDLLNGQLYRRVKELCRPCEKEPCEFGELDDDKWRKVKNWQKTCLKPL
ncbi:DgyrCDS595 [Dimorphilus gyrociliatus]|uniref:Small ribosomal subunit protein bS6m n=1 Tax=Dimorphilus gyrociliatus TaxID=2664684 RepID=A0A7I8V6N0_9ANNE|nr:DgyrCDS595 [Dimorphilus gyrociliatus]